MAPERVIRFAFASPSTNKPHIFRRCSRGTRTNPLDPRDTFWCSRVEPFYTHLKRVAPLLRDSDIRLRFRLVGEVIFWSSDFSSFFSLYCHHHNHQAPQPATTTATTNHQPPTNQLPTTNHQPPATSHTSPLERPRPVKTSDLKGSDLKSSDNTCLKSGPDPRDQGMSGVATSRIAIPAKL